MRYCLFSVVLFVVACQPTGGQLAYLPNGTAVAAMPTAVPDQIALGELVYVQQCASCHGFNLEGQPDWKLPDEDGSFRAPPHDSTGHTWHHGDPTLLEAVRQGGLRLAEMDIGATSNMPAFEDILSEKEITAVLAYIKSTWPLENQTFQWEATLREQQQAE